METWKTRFSIFQKFLLQLLLVLLLLLLCEMKTNYRVCSIALWVWYSSSSSSKINYYYYYFSFCSCFEFVRLGWIHTTRTFIYTFRKSVSEQKSLLLYFFFVLGLSLTRTTENFFLQHKISTINLLIEIRCKFCIQNVTHLHFEWKYFWKPLFFQMI